MFPEEGNFFVFSATKASGVKVRNLEEGLFGQASRTVFSEFAGGFKVLFHHRTSFPKLECEWQAFCYVQP